MRRSLTCVLYHHIGGETDFERGLSITTTLEAFERQISRMALDYDIIDLNTLLEGNMPKKALLITFDDFYYSVVESCKQVLLPRSIPSVFFVNSNLLGSENISIDCLLSWCVEKAGMKSVCAVLGVEPKLTLRDLISEVISSYLLPLRDEFRFKLIEKFGPIDYSTRSTVLQPKDLMGLSELGIEIGNHTATHVHCRNLTPEDIQNEIVASKHRLEALSGSKTRAFSVPYGNEQDLTPQVLRALKDSGHEAIFLVHARSNYLRPDKNVWYRVSLHNESPEEFSSKLVIKPILRSVKKFIFG